MIQTYADKIEGFTPTLAIVLRFPILGPIRNLRDGVTTEPVPERRHRKEVKRDAEISNGDSPLLVLLREKWDRRGIKPRYLVLPFLRRRKWDRRDSNSGPTDPIG